MKPIIIEGPDGVGKSTAIKRLQFKIHNRGGFDTHVPEVDHFTRERILHLRNEDEALGFFLGHLDHCDAPDPPRIFDRFHLGSWCYGFMNGLHPTWIQDTAMFARVAKLIMKQALVVVIYDKLGDYEKRMTNLLKVRPQREMFDLQQCLAVNQTYVDLDRLGLDDSSECEAAHIFHDVGYIGYPDDCHLEYWMEEAAKL